MRFRPEQHLRSQSEIRAVRTGGVRMDCRAYTVWCLRGGDRKTPRLAVAAPAAALKTAVQRNRARRRLREIFRKNQRRLPPDCDLLIVAKPAAALRPYEELEKSFVEICARVGSPVPARGCPS
jgi:ribonuclease P protein component